jgi:hypothetical protein
VSEKMPNKCRRRTARDQINRDLNRTFLFLLFLAGTFILIDYLLFGALW